MACNKMLVFAHRVNLNIIKHGQNKISGSELCAIIQTNSTPNEGDLLEL